MKEDPKMLQKIGKPELKKVDESRRLRVGEDSKALGANPVDAFGAPL